MVFNICVKFHKHVKQFLTYEADMKIVNTQRPTTHKAEKPELPFMHSACCLIVFNICVQFHENMSSGSKVMEQTRKLLTHKGQ